MKSIALRALLYGTLLLFSQAPVLGFDLKREEFNGKKYVVAWVNLANDNLSLFYAGPDGKPLRTFTAVKASAEAAGKRLAFAMNAGMFDLDYKPVGLCIERGVEHKALNLTNGQGNFYLKPNGLFYVDSTGAHVCKSEAYAPSNKVTLATQSGPMLLMAGQVHPKFNPNSTNRLVRNAVGVKDPKTVLLVISESEVTFYELAMLFKERLGCPDALFLDGLISKIYSPPLVTTDTGSDFGPMFGVVQDGR